MNPSEKKPGVSQVASKVDARTAEEHAALAAKDAAKAEKKSRQTDGKPKPLDVVKLEIPDADILYYLGMNRVGDATLYARLHRGKTVFVPQWNTQLIWAGHHWTEEDAKRSGSFQMIENVCQLYQRLADNKQQEAAEEVDKDLKAIVEKVADSAKKRANMLRDPSGQEKLMLQTRRIENPMMVDADMIDQNPYLIGCPNGVVDLRTGELRAGDPEDYIFNACPTEYDPALLDVDDPCPETNAFLLRSMDGDQELVDFIWRLLGYGLIRERRDHLFVIFWGEHGRNGKDTLIKLVTTVLGGNLSGDVPVEMFLNSGQIKNPSSSSTDVKELCGMCIAWINEAEDNQKFALAKLKKLTGGGLISARGNYEKKSTTWKQTHLPIMTTNAIPKANADDNAFWQRAVLVKWPLSFIDEPKEPYERKADKNLDDKVQAELKGVLARMVRGSMEYLREGLKKPKKVQDWTDEQRAGWDDLAQFITEWCVTEPHQENPDDYKTRIQATDFHEAFCIWYAINKDRRYSISPKKLAELLNKKNIPWKRSNGIWRLGITLSGEAWVALEKEQAKQEKGRTK